MRKKIAVIGGGHVGEMTACHLVMKNLGDVVLTDIIENMPQGKALDMWEQAPVEGYDCHLTGTNDLADIKGSDVIIVTAGVPRKPGMSRDDLLNVNYKIMADIAPKLADYCPDGIIIVVSNPLDVMVATCFKMAGLPKERVMGMAGILDTARFRSFIALEAGVSVESIQAMVLGGHGDTMVPLVRYTTIAGIPISHFIPKDRIDAIIERTRMGGGEIVKLLGTSAYYAPAAAVVEMAESILLDKKKILPCAARLEGEYGVSGIFMGVPIKLGAKGVEEIIKLDLNDEERAMLDKSVDHVKRLMEEMKI
ncbi:MAG TPA: malate dehydrogenase [Acidobacteriota bacterium]|nr:malate dehydrogenase [Acidobacteriota bacterium]